VSSEGRKPRVAVIGAGISGVCTAVRLHHAGYEFSVYEQAAGPGGTWWDNSYPGCEVDVDSHMYSFSFMPYDWLRTHGTQPELQRYVEDIIDRFGIRSRFHFSTKVDEAVWDDERGLYRVRIASGEEEEFEAVVSCLGILNNPKYPGWPGLDEFEGVKFHSARWNHDVDLAGKTVALVGTGSSAAQAVPQLAETVGQLYVYQRSPGWILPKGERDYTDEERDHYRGLSGLGRRKLRLHYYRHLTKGYDVFRIGSKYHEQAHALALQYIKETIEDPETRKAVTPDYPFGCKRVILASTFYPALNRENVELVPHAVERLTRDGIVSADGDERKVDVLIMATGFQPQRFLATLEIKGYGGRSIHDFWDGNPRAVLGITVPGFPNFFMCYGPNTNGGPGLMFMAEIESKAIVKMLRRLERRGGKAIDTRPRALDRYVKWVDKENRKRNSARFAGCTNYDFAPKGRAVLLWPRSAGYYNMLSRVIPPVATFVRR
jgi:cation diffusion facilitator CzcD-associated flavoprotein CzcO